MDRVGVFVGIVVVGVVLLGGVAGTASAQDSLACAPESPTGYPDAPNGTAGTIGYVDGYWYDEPLTVSQQESLTERELDAVVARTAARVEVLRCDSFDTVPSVNVIDRDTFRANQQELFAAVSAPERQFDNAKLETLLVVASTEDSIAQRRANRGTAVLGYYDPRTDRIVVIADEGQELRIEETTLAHELVHAYQDQHYNLTVYNATKTDPASAENGLIEGDAVSLEDQYQSHCEGSWQCLKASTGSSSPIANWGLFVMTLQPYLDGPQFIQELQNRDEDNWTAVDAAFNEPPTTSKHIIAPTTYPEFEPELPTVPDRSTAQWERLSVPDRPDYETFGPVGLAAPLMAPEFSDRSFDDSIEPYQYDHPVVTGWEGDKLWVYTNETNATATVWRINYTHTTNATAYRDRYTSLLEYHGAEPVTTDTFRFPNESAYTGAVRVTQQDAQLTIVHAPTQQSLGSVHDAPHSPRATPGFGLLSAVLVLVVLGVRRYY